MEYEQDEDTNSKSFAERIKESPRTVSALIIILIVAAAIYAFSDTPEQQPTELASNNETAVEESEETNSEEETVEQTEEENAQQEGEQQVSAPEPVSRETLAQENEGLAQGEKTDSGYVEAAQAGEGFTHIARRATTRYLNENNVEYNITNEHRIYIEDYIQNRLGTRGLEVGEQQTVSFDLLREAVAAAGNLTPQQLNNLTQYTSALS